MLRVQEISKSFKGPRGPVPVLAGFSLELAASEFVAVQGPSGCGKTTLLLAAAGLLRPDRGSVWIDGEAVYEMGAEARARLRAVNVGMVFQQFHLVEYLSVYDNVLCPALALTSPQARARATELVVRLGLEHRAEHVPSQLSIGERQRVALGRALLNRPKLLLADEPTGNLDNNNAAVILDCLSEFAAAGGAVLMVTHEARAAARAGRTITLDRISAGTVPAVSGAHAAETFTP